MASKVTVVKAVVSAAPKTPNPKVVFATQMSGYDKTSPIWQKQLPEVLDMIDSEIAKGVPHMNVSGRVHLNEITKLTGELRKRIAKGKLIKAQR